MRQIRNQAVAVAAVAALGVLASCSSDDQQSESDSQAEVDPSATDGGSTTSTTPAPDYTILGATYLVGPGRWALPAVGDPEAPLAVIDVSADYNGRDGFVWLDVDAGFGQVLYRAPTRVFVDPCDVDRPSRPLGPTVDDLAEALAEQRRTTTTPPVPVTLGGYSGLYLELSSSDGVNFEACGPEGEMLIFEAGTGGGRVFDGPATERYWILDVKGRRVVVSAFTTKGADSPFVESVTDVAEAVAFVEAAPAAPK